MTNASERRERRRQELKRLQWVQSHANALAAENGGGKIDVDELDRRLLADIEAHPELLRFLGTPPPSPDNDE